MATLKRELREILERYEIDPRDKTKLWDCHGTLVLYHRAYEIIAAQEAIKFDAPQVIEANSEGRVVAICVTGHMGERSEWSIGEAAPANNKNGYPYAIAEKRAKDRVVAKLVGLAAYVYSEDEADEFRDGPKAEVADIPQRQTGKEVRPHTEQPHNAQPPSSEPAGAKETAGQRIMRELRKAKYPSTINTILAGNVSKFNRWREMGQDAAVDEIEKLAEDRKVELGG
jgi:hypothetical protein